MPVTLVSRPARVAAGIVAAFAALAIVLAASGWLYLAGPGPHLPGPAVGEALPLDELAGAALPRAAVVERRRTRVVLAWFTAAAGGLAVIDSFLPEHSRTLLSELAPQARPLASALAAPFGLALVYVARGLARGHRRAW